MKNWIHYPPRLVPLLSLAAFTGCSSGLLDVGPEYQSPSIEAPASFQNSDELAGAQELSPRWWDLFGDPSLSYLIETALAHNQDLAAAAHRVEQARALAGQARADLFPQLAIEAQAGRQQSLQTGYQAGEYVRIPGMLSYEIDLWGGVRRGASAANATADSAQRNYEAARLSLSAQVAETVYLLRAARIEEGIVSATVDTRREARDVIAAQHQLGSAAELDLVRAETELAIAEAERAAVARQRSQLTNALAILVGEAAPTFSLEILGSTLPTPPAVPGGMPAEVLQQRPDLAAAERALAAAADRIGVARAAFYPGIRLTASGGWESDDLDAVFSGSRQIWAIGPQVYLPLFQGGRNRARLAGANAAFEEQQALFRQTVLIALAEVQDALTAGRLLSDQAAANDRATVAARRAAALSRTRYDAGYVGYLEVVDSERIALAAERTQAQLQAQRLAASIQLIKALGGGWRPTKADPTLARH